MRLKKFSTFKENNSYSIFESMVNESVVYYSPRLRDILYKIAKNDDIALSLLGSERKDIKDDMTFIDLDESKPGYITFTKIAKAKQKLDKDSDYSDLSYRINDFSTHTVNVIYNNNIADIFKKDRNSIKISRAVSKLTDEKFTPPQIDLFSRKVMAKFSKEGNKFKLVSGNDIGDWYNVDKYSEIKGSLGSSCMRDKSGSFFELYNKNEDVCSMLILLDDEDKLIGRALIWKLHKHDHSEAPKDVYFMDRQYVIDETDVQRFRDYADSKDWAYKTNNNHSSLKKVTYKGSTEEVDMEVLIKVNDYSKYPYMDTFRIYNPNTGILYNSSDNDSEDLYTLDSTTGGYTEVNQGIYSEYDDEYIDEDYAVWSDEVSSYLHVDRATEVTSGSRSNRGWYPDGHDNLVYDEWLDENIHMDDAVYSDYYGYYILQDNSCQAITKVDSDGEPKLDDIVCDDATFYKKIKYDNTSWYKKLSDEFDDYKYFIHLNKDITYIDLNGDICLEEFKIKVKKVKKHSAKAIELGFENIIYLDDRDSTILECEMEEIERNYDMFQYFKDLEDILPTYYKFLEQKEEMIYDTIKDLKYQGKDKTEELDNINKLLSKIELVMSDIESNKYIEVELE